MEENVTHLRSQKELVCIMEKANKEGHLPETILKEFAGRPFPMPALWACRDYFHQLDMETCRSHPALPPILALLSAMEGIWIRQRNMCSFWERPQGTGSRRIFMKETIIGSVRSWSCPT